MVSINRLSRLKAAIPVLILISFASAQTTERDDREPTATSNGTVGMSQIVSAEPMGDSRLSLQLRGNFYQQAFVHSGLPPKDAQITTSTGAIAYGMNSYMDVFGSFAAYNLRKDGPNNGSGLGSTTLGLQGSIPVSQSIPSWIGLQVTGIFGTSKKEIDTNRSNRFDGYDYLDTRTYNDVLARLTQTIFFPGEKMGLRIHLNEGALSSFQSGKEVAILGGAGIEYLLLSDFVFGLEANARTSLKKPETSDPLWVTPSFSYRTPFHLNIQIGSDVSVSKKPTDGSERTLEPWRAFGSITFSMDLLAKKRNQLTQKQKQDSLERDSLTYEKNLLIQQITAEQSKADSLARENSMTLAQQKAQSDSLMTAADYLAIKSHQDSLNLIETQKELESERSKRSDAEKQLLSTGLLLLDAVYFETGKTEVSINSKPYLNIIAKMLLKYPQLQIEISGHTDNVGSAASNTRLSQGRAESVMQYMIEAAPGLQTMLSAKGYGFTQPKADNGTAEGRKLNRRTELRVLNTDVLKQYSP